MKIRIPYGKTFEEREVDPSRVLIPKTDALKSEKDGKTLVKEALEHPVDSPRLSVLSKDKRNAVVIISDHTRPVPSKDIIPLMLEELREGNPDIDITLLVATGCHRGTTADELRGKLGNEIVDREKIVVHDCDDPTCVYLGDLPSGAHFSIDRLAAETELLVAEGFIEPHFFAGFSGGRKSVLPGVCARKTVLGNHCGAFIDDPHARTGILDGNPIHIDMDRAAEMAKLAFIVNVVIDEEKHTVAAFAGNFRSAHRRGVEFLMQFCGVQAIPGDIVVTSNGGAPLDQNIYQCVKSMTAAEASCRPGGTIITLGECADGIGGDFFYRQLAECATPRQLYDDLTATPMEETEPDQWQSQILVRILDHYRVILVTRPELKKTVENMKMTYAGSLDEALSIAGDGEITWIPNGVSLVVTE